MEFSFVDICVLIRIGFSCGGQDIFNQSFMLFPQF